MSVYHLAESGPRLCVAKPGNCPLGGDHFSNHDDANAAFEQKLAATLEPFNPLKNELVDLPCAFGTMKVRNGDLTDHRARNALISGLCGSLAYAIQQKYGGDAYFVAYGVDDPSELEEHWKEDHLVDVSPHVLMESRSKPGHFMDSYGQRTLDEIKEFYGDDIALVKGTPAMVESYSQKGVRETLDKFADAVVKLDAANEGYSYTQLIDDYLFDEENSSVLD